MSRSLENAEAAVAQLVAYLAVPVTSDRDRAGVIQAFEFSLEAVWKLLKHVAERDGLPAESPRRALMAGSKLGLIADESLWMDMLDDRNLTSHVYHHQVAARIFGEIRDRYARALVDVVERARRPS